MILPFLAKSASVKLDEHGYPGVVVHFRPMDLHDKAEWADKCRVAKTEVYSTKGRKIALHQQITSIDGLQFRSEDKKTVASYDPENEDHFRSLPLAFIFPVFQALEQGLDLTEEELGKLGQPSESGKTPAGDGSGADPAPNASETKTSASSKATKGS